MMDHDESGPPLRRSCLLVAGNAPDELKGAGRFPADELIFDLADVARSEKDTARVAIIEALIGHAYGEPIVSVRVNPMDTMWAYRDVVDIVERAGELVDCITIPGVRTPADVEFVDALLRMIEERIDLAHNIAIEAQIGTAQGLTLVGDIVLASDRIEALILDTAGMADALGIAAASDLSTQDVLHPVRMTLLVAARTAGVRAVEAYGDEIRNDAYRRAAKRSRTLGYDGAWCTHPDQVRAANEAFLAV
jgi:citrate lyase beta subunit